MMRLSLSVTTCLQERPDVVVSRAGRERIAHLAQEQFVAFDVAQIGKFRFSGLINPVNGAKRS